MEAFETSIEFTFDEYRAFNELLYKNVFRMGLVKRIILIYCIIWILLSIPNGIYGIQTRTNMAFHIPAAFLGLLVFFIFCGIEKLLTMRANNKWQTHPLKNARIDYKFGLNGIFIKALGNEHFLSCTQVWRVYDKGDRLYIICWDNSGYVINKKICNDDLIKMLYQQYKCRKIKEKRRNTD